MNGPLDNAAKGLYQSQTQLAKSAQRLVRAAQGPASTQFTPGDAESRTGSGGAQLRGDKPAAEKTSRPTPARAGGASIKGQGSYIPSLAEETLQMRMAANAYKANAVMMETAEEILRLTQERLADLPDDAGEDRSQSDDL